LPATLASPPQRLADKALSCSGFQRLDFLENQLDTLVHVEAVIERPCTALGEGIVLRLWR